MGLKGKRKNIKTGKYSQAFIIPAGLKIGNSSTYAADRLIIIDPRGDIPAEQLLQFLEDHIEPGFWPWLAEQNKKSDRNVEQ